MICFVSQMSDQLDAAVQLYLVATRPRQALELLNLQYSRLMKVAVKQIACGAGEQGKHVVLVSRVKLQI